MHINELISVIQKLQDYYGNDIEFDPDYSEVSNKIHEFTHKGVYFCLFAEYSDEVSVAPMIKRLVLKIRGE